MPHRSPRARRVLVRLLVLFFAGVFVGVAARRREREKLAVAAAPGSTVSGATVVPFARRRRRRPLTRRLAAGVTFAAIFVGGAALTATAGNEVASVFASGSETIVAANLQSAQPDAAPAAQPDASAPVAEQPAEEAPAAEAAPVEQPAAQPELPAAPAPAAEDSSPTPSGDSSAASGSASTADASSLAPAVASPVKTKAQPSPLKKVATPVRRRTARPRPVVVKPAPIDPEAHTPGTTATIWLNAALPDPTPPALRLTPDFARRLTASSRRAHVNWALVLGVLRAKGQLGAVPASPLSLRSVARRLSGSGSAWADAYSFSGQASFADRAVALSRYYRAVGLQALVQGLEAAKGRLAKQLLDDRDVLIYTGGQDDLLTDRVDVRVLAVVAYLRQIYGEVTVSCLVSGHRLYARPGVVSAHIFGRAVDVTALGGVSIAGHQEPGGLTEHAVRDLLLLPPEVRPRQIISLLGLGGPSFPLADHADHIHVGF